MPSFAFRAVNPSGRRIRGQQDATTSSALALDLEKRGLVVLDIQAPASEGRSFSFGVGRRRAVLDVARGLAALLRAGMPLPRALQAVSQVCTGSMQNIVIEVRDAVRRGVPLASAFSEHPDYFSSHFVGLVRSGERSGDLSGAIQRLANQLEHDDQLRSRIISVSIYPLLLAILGGGAVVVLLTIVLPRFADLLRDAGAELPRSTMVLLAVSNAVQHFWFLFVIIAVLCVSIMVWGHSSLAGQRASAASMLKIPLVGTVRRDAIAAEFARLISALLESGSPILQAMDDTAVCLTDPLVRDELIKVRALVRDGAPLSRAIGTGRFFPPLLAQLVEIGEEAGQLQEFLSKAAELLEAKVERSTQRLVALLEPAMIIFFGSIVAVVALSLLQAIYGINASAFR